VSCDTAGNFCAGVTGGRLFVVGEGERDDVTTGRFCEGVIRGPDLATSGALPFFVGESARDS
jgi:hypothetical protein